MRTRRYRRRKFQQALKDRYGSVDKAAVSLSKSTQLSVYKSQLNRIIRREGLPSLRLAKTLARELEISLDELVDLLR